MRKHAYTPTPNLPSTGTGGFSKVDEWLKLNPDKVKPIIDAIFNTRTGMAVLGGGAGGLIGSLTPTGEEGIITKKRLRNALIGAASGTGVGLGAAHLAPAFSKSLLKGIYDPLLVRPVGRLMTNTVMPFNYSNKAQNTWAFVKKEPMLALKVLLGHDPWEGVEWIDELADAPAKGEPPPPRRRIFNDARELPFRQMFGLAPRAGATHYPRNEDGTRRLTKNQEYAMTEGAAVHNIDGIAEAAAQGRQHVMQELVLGNYVPTFDLDKKTMSYNDPWDFALSGDDSKQLDSSTKILRYLVSKFTTPVTFKNDIPLTNDQVSALRKALNPPASQPLAQSAL